MLARAEFTYFCVYIYTYIYIYMCVCVSLMFIFGNPGQGLLGGMHANPCTLAGQCLSSGGQTKLEGRLASSDYQCQTLW